METLRNRAMVDLIGGFNAKTHSGHVANPNVVGPYDNSCLNTNGKFSIDLAITLFKHKQVRRFTWICNFTHQPIQQK